MAGSEREPRAYELMTVFIPELSEEDNQAQIERVGEYISSAGGTVKETRIESPWGRRRLAYEIRFNNVDYRDGYYTLYLFDSAPSLLTALERDLKLDTSTMRYLLVHDDPKAGEKFPQTDGADAGDSDATSGENGDQPSPAAAATSDSSEVSSEAEKPSAEESDKSSDDAPTSEAADAGATADEAPLADAEEQTSEAPTAEADTDTAEAPETETDSATSGNEPDESASTEDSPSASAEDDAAGSQTESAEDEQE